MHFLTKSGMAIGVIAAASSLHATPFFTEFGALGTEFGGDGISGNSVAITTQFYNDLSDAPGNQSAVLLLGLTATERLQNDPVTNNGAGVFFAQAGSNNGTPPVTADPALPSVWNFSFFIEATGVNGTTPALEDFQIDLFYDFDPAADTPRSELGRIDVTAGLVGTGISLVEGSQNINFDFLEGGFPGIFPPSSITGFDPNAPGEYSFEIVATSLAGLPESEQRVAIDVIVIPEPASAVLLGLGGLLAMKRRRHS